MDEKEIDELLGEIGEDEFATDDIVTLVTSEGEEVRFIEIAGIAHRGKFYAILQPEELPEGMSEDQALVFRVTRGSEGQDQFELEMDEEICNAVFATYMKMIENIEAENDEKQE